ncbi:MAG: VanW family protein [Actinomycetota bacterium]|nr:VanW family protein [Actinomycetota bacterium]
MTSWIRLSQSRVRPFLVIALGALVGLVAVVAAWLVQSRMSRNAVLPNVVLLDSRIRGVDADELRTKVAEIASRFSAAAVDVRTPEGSFQATVPELGVAVDEEGTTREVLAAGRRGPAPRRLFDWARSFLSPIRVPVAIEVDRRSLDKVVAERDPSRTPPVEPNLEVRDGRLDGVPGKPGRGVNPEELADALRRAKPSGANLVVEMNLSAVPPRFSEADADQLAAEGEALAGGQLQVVAGGSTVSLPPEMVRRWLDADPGDEALRLGIRDDADITEDLAGLLADAGVSPVNAGFTVNGGRVSITPSRTGTACCGPEARDRVAAAVTDPAQRSSPIELPMKTVRPARDEEAASRLGIVEQVGTFTTPHAGGEPRVANIHRMADTLRGVVIEPGATFSINGTVGQRTKEKGYVEAPIITSEYKFEADVGGGVSQFATTMFNAAFFAGLDITEYAMHGLYISRYPYGREATLSYPSPDLKIRNSTPYGVLVWPSYTNTSITVTLYSTKYVEGEQTGQTREEIPSRPPPNSPPEISNPGPCVAVTTVRTRRYLTDGRTAVDRFSGLYAPAEGWTCSSRG